MNIRGSLLYTIAQSENRFPIRRTECSAATPLLYDCFWHNTVEFAGERRKNNR